jgi:hypothetical protein
VTAVAVARRAAYAVSPLGLAAMGLPIVALVVVLMRNAPVTAWMTMATPVRGQVAAELLLLETALAIVAAPLAGVALIERRRERATSAARAQAAARRLGSPLTVTIALATHATLFTAVAACLVAGLIGMQPGSAAAIAIPHVTLWSATLALGAVGSLLATVCRDPLDAAATASGVSLVAAGGVLMAGPSVADWPTAAINAALQTSPMVAVAASADIDILRMEWLYRLSPLAHIRFDYPAWHATCAWYLSLALVATAATVFRLTRTSPARSFERIN